jgi:hypothetical protein
MQARLIEGVSEIVYSCLTMDLCSHLKPEKKLVFFALCQFENVCRVLVWSHEQSRYIHNFTQCWSEVIQC